MRREVHLINRPMKESLVGYNKEYGVYPICLLLFIQQILTEQILLAMHYSGDRQGSFLSS